MKNTLICLLLSLAFLQLFGCGSPIQNKISIKEKLQIEQNKTEEEIINATMKLIIPDSLITKTRSFLASKSFNKNGVKYFYNDTLTLFLFETLLVADEKDIKRLIEKGANNLIKKLNWNILASKSINVEHINGFNSIKTPISYPLSTSEFDHSIGSIIYSRIILSKSKNEAVFMVDFENARERQNSFFCAVEVRKKNNVWGIFSKIYLDKKNTNSMFHQGKKLHDCI